MSLHYTACSSVSVSTDSRYSKFSFALKLRLKVGLQAKNVVRQGLKQMLREGQNGISGQVPKLIHP